MEVPRDITWTIVQMLEPGDQFSLRFIKPFSSVVKQIEGNNITAAARHAARTGNSKMLEWLHVKLNMPLKSAFLCEFAAAGGQLDLLKWLRERNCPWDWRTCHQASLNGHMEIIRWATANGAEWQGLTKKGGSA